MDLGLNGKTVLITGASKGIGLACAHTLAREGCRLYLAARSKALLESVKNDLAKKYAAAVEIYPADLSDGNQVQELIKACAGLELLINNAGAIPTGDLSQIDEETWRKAWDLKVFGYINMCREAYACLKQNGGGVILNIIGAAGERPSRRYIAGGTANAGLMGFTRALGADSLKDHIRVLGINPGLIQTERLERVFKSAAQKKIGDESLWKNLLPKDPKPGKPEDIADLAAFLLSPRAANITGTVVTSDGGYSAK